MDRHLPSTSATHLARLLGRWVLLGAVIAGVLAMHVLSEPDGLDGHSMPAGMVVTAEMVAAPNMPGMGMGAGRADAKVAAPPPAAAPVSATMAAPDSSGMTAMTCCTLFLLTGAGLLLTLLLRAIRRRPEMRLGSSALQRFSRRRRGPPIAAPRTLLCVLRV